MEEIVIRKIASHEVESAMALPFPRKCTVGKKTKNKKLRRSLRRALSRREIHQISKDGNVF
jgi:hypothetical protein